jgi:hypothetical protein
MFARKASSAGQFLRNACPASLSLLQELQISLPFSACTCVGHGLQTEISKQILRASCDACRRRESALGALPDWVERRSFRMAHGDRPALTLGLRSGANEPLPSSLHIAEITSLAHCVKTDCARSRPNCIAFSVRIKQMNKGARAERRYRLTPSVVACIHAFKIQPSPPRSGQLRAGGALSREIPLAARTYRALESAGQKTPSKGGKR